MTLAAGNTERAKFGYLLELSQEQIQALESDDMYAFDRILAAKRTLIESLSNARGLMAADPDFGRRRPSHSRRRQNGRSVCCTAKSVASCAR